MLNKGTVMALPCKRWTILSKIDTSMNWPLPVLFLKIMADKIPIIAEMPPARSGTLVYGIKNGVSCLSINWSWKKSASAR